MVLSPLSGCRGHLRVPRFSPVSFELWKSPCGEPETLPLPCGSPAPEAVQAVDLAARLLQLWALTQHFIALGAFGMVGPVRSNPKLHPQPLDPTKCLVQLLPQDGSKSSSNSAGASSGQSGLLRGLWFGLCFHELLHHNFPGPDRSPYVCCSLRMSASEERPVSWGEMCHLPLCCYLNSLSTACSPELFLFSPPPSGSPSPGNCPWEKSNTTPFILDPRYQPNFYVANLRTEHRLGHMNESFMYFSQLGGS